MNSAGTVGSINALSQELECRSQKALLTYSRGMLKRLFSFDVQHDVHDFPLRVVDVTKNLATSFASKTC